MVLPDRHGLVQHICLLKGTEVRTCILTFKDNELRI